jgi:Ni,Fe-hydrogenase III large subunit/Ni,Fe-hydrogenase III component G
MSDIHDGVRQSCQKPWLELPRRASNEFHFVITDGGDMERLCLWVKEQTYYLCTLVTNDERALEDHVFKLYYVFSAPEGYLVIFEHPLSDPKHPEQYPSIREVFPSVEELELEAYDMIGLSPQEYLTPHGFVLHEPYPADLYPLRPRRSLKALLEKIENTGRRPALPLPQLPDGMLFLPVGPIHAGIIEAGHFRFHIAGEVIENLDIRLGYKHRGIEKLFQAQYTVEQGWELAEKVSGDSSFAHAMAYCEAAEALAGSEPPRAALYWRGLFLELERIYNHISDVGALVHDMAFDLVASEISVLREKMVRLNQYVTGHRLLRGVNRPGGIVLKRVPDLEALSTEVVNLTGEFLRLGELIMKMPACRDRAFTTGILTGQEVKKCGATGLVARASCGAVDIAGTALADELRQHDFRLKHLQGVYKLHPKLGDEIRNTIITDQAKPSANFRRVRVFQKELQGDIFARMALRVAEVETSSRIIQRLASRMKKFATSEPVLIDPDIFTQSLRKTPNFEFGIGYVEGWRGDIFYWLMKGPGNTIFRCKVRDPSLFNWPALRLATIRKPKPEANGKPPNKGYWENILADFPLINKSFNLSYAGHDL